MSRLSALEVTLATDKRFKDPANAAIVDLCRTLAQAMDDREEPTTQQIVAYLSALKDLRRITDGQPKGAAADADSDEGRPSLASIKGGIAQRSA